jgi:hypothetical protein
MLIVAFRAVDVYTHQVQRYGSGQQLPDDQFVLYLAAQLEKWTGLHKVYSRYKGSIFAVARHETKKQALHEYGSCYLLQGLGAT